MAAPSFPQPMSVPLAAISQELLLPGLQGIPAETVTAAIPNTRFIESYMVGLNHEMARELLFREYPTDMRGTYFRQAMFAEFERDVHAKVDKGEALSGGALSKIYGDILRRYHGQAQGIVTIDDVDTVEWAYIPHFYNSFYVYQYATSIAASSLFADGVLKNQPGARERYLGLLRSGGSDDPYELVKRAGVDLASPAPYQSIAARMDRIMDEIEAIRARQAKH